MPFFHVREGPSTEPGAVVYASKPVTGLKKKKDTELLVKLDTVRMDWDCMVMQPIKSAGM